MSTRFVIALSFLTAAGLSSSGLNAGTFDGYLDLSLSADRTEFRAVAEATYYYQGTEIDYNAELTGNLRVEQTTPAVNFDLKIDKQGRFADVLEGPTQFGACYYSNMEVTADPWGPFNSESRTWNAGPACYTRQPDPDPDPEPIVINPGSPIVFSLRGGYSLSGADDPVLFDIDADGRPDRMGWTARGTDEAFLALDRNADGRITDGRELFGDATLLHNGEEAHNGFEALKEFDENDDGRIDDGDTVWTRLILWRDANHDGLSSNSELTGVTATDVAAIGLDYQWTGRRDRHGNEFRYKAKLETARGSPIHEQVYDVYFVVLR